MAYNEQLAQRIRSALSDLPNVTEKKMFGGLAFLLNDKMCINVGNDRIMCRIDPVLHDEALTNKGTRTLIMKGREYKGFIHVDEAAIKTKKELDYWIELSVDYNKYAKSSRSR
ncbi:MAG: TfoX family protein [Chitinophagaceae bacterium]|nr:MAG: TfoX family protein [Chitinophagaceae bacterium]